MIVRKSMFSLVSPARLFALALVLMATLAVTPQAARADSADWLANAFAGKPSNGPSYLGTSFGSTKKSARRSRKGVQVASLGGYAPSSLVPSLSGGNVRWAAPSDCLNGTLRGVIADMASYGHVTVNSTCRGHGHNARVGGAPHSQHLQGNAVDFRIRGNYGAAYAALRSNGALGGIKHMGGGLFHIDTGPKRSW